MSWRPKIWYTHSRCTLVCPCQILRQCCNFCTIYVQKCSKNHVFAAFCSILQHLKKIPLYEFFFFHMARQRTLWGCQNRSPPRSSIFFNLSEPPWHRALWLRISKCSCHQNLNVLRLRSFPRKSGPGKIHERVGLDVSLLPTNHQINDSNCS